MLLPLSTVVDINLELDHPQLYFFLKIQLIKYDYDFVWQAVSSHPI